MGNCLVTKLKGSVNADLPRLGEIRYSMKVDSDLSLNSNDIRTVNDELIDVRILTPGVTFSSASGSSVIIDSKNAKLKPLYGNSISLSGVSEGSIVKYGLTEKYALKSFMRNGSVAGNMANTELDLSEFVGMTNLVNLFLGKQPNGVTVTGSIDQLSPLTELESISIQNQDISGDIQSLGTLTKLTSLSLPQRTTQNYLIVGNWVDFVNAQKENNRLTCESLAINTMSRYSKIRFGSAGVPSAADLEDAVLAWSGSKISYTYETSMKIYVIGYSPAEIDELEGQGYTVVTGD